MQVYDYFFLVLGAVLILAGLASLVTGKIYLMGGNPASKYTEESLAKYARPHGISNILLGAGFVLEHVFSNEVTGLIACGVCLVLACVIVIVSKKVLVKK